MTEESLQKLFTDVKTAPAETNVADVSQWIENVATIGGGTTIIQKILQKKLIIMTSIITATIIGTIIFFSTDSDGKKEIKVTPSIEINPLPDISTINPIEQNKKSENLLPITQPAIIDTPAALNLIPAQKEALQIENETPKIINSDTNELPQKNEDYISSGSWKSKNDSLHVDTVFNGIKAIIFKGRVNDKIFVNGSNRANVAMNYNYKYKVKGIYSRKNRDCEVSFEKKDSVLTIEIDRKNGGIAYFTPTPEEYSNFLCRIFDNWIGNGMPQNYVRLFEEMLFEE